MVEIWDGEIWLVLGMVSNWAESGLHSPQLVAVAAACPLCHEHGCCGVQWTKDAFSLQCVFTYIRSYRAYICVCVPTVNRSCFQSKMKAFVLRIFLDITLVEFARMEDGGSNAWFWFLVQITVCSDSSVASRQELFRFVH